MTSDLRCAPSGGPDEDFADRYAVSMLLDTMRQLAALPSGADQPSSRAGGPDPDARRWASLVEAAAADPSGEATRAALAALVREQADRLWLAQAGAAEAHERLAAAREELAAFSVRVPLLEAEVARWAADSASARQRAEAAAAEAAAIEEVREECRQSRGLRGALRGARLRLTPGGRP